MDKNLTVEQFSDILMNSYHNYVHNLQAKAFDSCVDNFEKPYLSIEEKECISSYSLKYISTIQHTIVHFSRKIVDFNEN